MTKLISDPRYALIQVEGGYLVERFDPSKHLGPYGAPPWITLFDDEEQVAHLRDQILN